MKTLQIIQLTCFFILAIFSNTNAQDSRSTAAIKTMIESKHFLFIAQMASPMSGRTRQLTSDYDLKIKPDTIDSDLPYFGRAYTAPIDPADAGIDFTSVKFDYNIIPGKKGGWEITIKPKDVTDINGMYLSVSENGYALLRVNSNNRQAISFTGYIADKK